jgi:hypothetical protein
LFVVVATIFVIKMRAPNTAWVHVEANEKPREPAPHAAVSWLDRPLPPIPEMPPIVLTTPLKIPMPKVLPPVVPAKSTRPKLPPYNYLYEDRPELQERFNPEYFKEAKSEKK